MLDETITLRRQDPAGMYDRIAESVDQIVPAWRVADAAELPPNYRDCQSIVVLGMGGSAIGGDLVRGLLQDQLHVPLQVSRDYDIPAHVGPETLVIVSSYSGCTEETISAATQAGARGARLLALTTGGTLADLAQRSGWQLLRFAYTAQPRAAWTYGFFPLLNLLGRLGYVSGHGDAVRALVSSLGERSSAWRMESLEETNEAKQLARLLAGRIAVVYGAGHLAAVARRWKGQINENAKSWAFYEELPEANHNAAVGYPNPTAAKERLTVLFVDSAGLNPRVRRRYQVTQALLDREGVTYRVVDAGGEDALQQLVHTLVLGDYVSYYLAQLNRVDPTPVAAIDYLKAELARD